VQVECAKCGPQQPERSKGECVALPVDVRERARAVRSGLARSIPGLAHAALRTSYHRRIRFGLPGIRLRPDLVSFDPDPIAGEVHSRRHPLVGGNKGILAIRLLDQKSMADSLEAHVLDAFKPRRPSHRLKGEFQATFRSCAWAGIVRLRLCFGPAALNVGRRRTRRSSIRRAETKRQHESQASDQGKQEWRLR
jgi:hypothetical protein